MRTLTLCVVALLTACTTAPPTREALLTEHDLLFGNAVTTLADTPPPLTPEDAFGIDDTMRAFVAANVNKKAPNERLAQLLIAMKNHGLASLAYDDGVTRSARETFYAGSANCLSFTMLFVALAREAGLSVRYQDVEVPPTWSKGAEIVVVRNHVNALVNTRTGTDYIVDFNLEDFNDAFDRRRVRDEYAQSLFYNNLAAEALVRKDYATSIGYLREALRLDPKSTAAWSNLGLWHLRMGRPDRAEAAYLRASNTDPRDPTVLTNLAALYSTLGQHGLVRAYEQRIRSYQQRNPFYHFATAQAAYEQRRFDTALQDLRRAIRLKDDEHDFHQLRGKVYLELGETSAAEQSFARAKALAPQDLRAEAEARLEELAASGASP